jgi:hypothetical protein
MYKLTLVDGWDTKLKKAQVKELTKMISKMKCRDSYYEQESEVLNGR